MICIVLFTCGWPQERQEYAIRTIRSLAGLRGSQTWIHIADDGSSPEFRQILLAEASAHFATRVSISNAEGRGYGASYNLASQQIHQNHDFQAILPLEDDWELTRELYLPPLVELLARGVYNCIRLGYIGYTDELWARFAFHAGQHYLELSPASPERHIFAGGPRLETAAFQKSVGPWPEGLPAGETELVVASRPESRVGVAWPVSLTPPEGTLFAHIGTLKAATAARGSQWPAEAKP